MAETLDYLQALPASKRTPVRIRTHDGAAVQGILRSASRRHVELLQDAATPVHFDAGRIARIEVAVRRLTTLWRERWEVWFEYGEEREPDKVSSVGRAV